LVGSAELFAGSREIGIRHANEIYTLRQTNRVSAAEPVARDARIALAGLAAIAAIKLKITAETVTVVRNR
jgi:hypothetical protein